MSLSAERKRLAEDKAKKSHWRRWGPYLSDRQWGTVREDYSWNGEAWAFFPHDHARSRAYRWGEDGIAGISDNHQRLCFAPAFWNGEDPILKERYFGLTGAEGNHGEDVKEYYYYLDNTPTHSYMKCLYKYPHGPFPYEKLLEENRRRGQDRPEFELVDTGIFSENRYFDIFVEYAKSDAEDILICLRIFNRGPDTQTLHVLPTLWFRNTWSWNTSDAKPEMRLNGKTIEARVKGLGTRYLFWEDEVDNALFTENETNYDRLFQSKNTSPFVKDAFHDYVIHGREDAVNPAKSGTKAALHFRLSLEPESSRVIRLRLSNRKISSPFRDFERIFNLRKQEADRFYGEIISQTISEDHRQIQRQAFAGMLWSKQFYHYVIQEWLGGDETGPTPPEFRQQGRNNAWPHFYSEDILSMPDAWEYPWFAAWDLSFHTIPLALVDSEFAKKQLQ